MEEILGSSEPGPEDILTITILKKPHCHNITLILQACYITNVGEEVRGPSSGPVIKGPSR